MKVIEFPNMPEKITHPVVGLYGASNNDQTCISQIALGIKQSAGMIYSNPGPGTCNDLSIVVKWCATWLNMADIAVFYYHPGVAASFFEMGYLVGMGIGSTRSAGNTQREPIRILIGSPLKHFCDHMTVVLEAFQAPTVIVYDSLEKLIEATRFACQDVRGNYNT